MMQTSPFRKPMMAKLNHAFSLNFVRKLCHGRKIYMLTTQNIVLCEYRLETETLCMQLNVLYNRLMVKTCLRDTGTWLCHEIRQRKLAPN